jgi:hypothetical protein
MQNRYKVQEGQTLFDIAIHIYGTIEAAFEIANLAGLSITEELVAGSTIPLPKITRPEQMNPYVVALLANRNIVPCTAPDIFSEYEGLGYMQVGISLKIN